MATKLTLIFKRECAVKEDDVDKMESLVLKVIPVNRVPADPLVRLAHKVQKVLVVLLACLATKDPRGRMDHQDHLASGAHQVKLAILVQ